MIILDTNVLSEVLKPVPDERVVRWMRAAPTTALSTTAICRAELLYGVLLLPQGQRRARLAAAIDAIFDVELAGRILGFDSGAADAYALIASERRASGRPISQADAMIAAVARSHGAVLATRNSRDFQGCGIELIDPWSA